MHDIQSQFVKNILAGKTNNPREHASAFAASNIALCKYWGKRDAALNLPINSSLSISLGNLGTTTEIRVRETEDQVWLNGKSVSREAAFAKRITSFLDLFRPRFGNGGFEVRTENNIPTAAGLASSASGFAALVLALNELGGWGLGGGERSMLARLGSGSASRSIFNGFVQWNAGTNSDGTDSFAEKLPFEWPDFRIGILELSSAKKPVGSRDGMNRTVETSQLYKSWPAQAEADLKTIRTAIKNRDFQQLGQTAEKNALSMHATMMSAWPPLIYLQPETIEQIHNVQKARTEGLDVYLTIDAGPNIKLLYRAEDEGLVQKRFPDLQTIQPFG